MQCLTQSGSKPDLDCHSIFLVIVATFDSKPDLLGSKPDTVRQHGRHNIDFVVTAGKTKDSLCPLLYLQCFQRAGREQMVLQPTSEHPSTSSGFMFNAFPRVKLYLKCVCFYTQSSCMRSILNKKSFHSHIIKHPATTTDSTTNTSNATAIWNMKKQHSIITTITNASCKSCSLRLL